MTNKTSIEWVDYTPDYLITDGALYLVDDASGFIAVRGQLDSSTGPTFEYASDDFEDMSYDHEPARIALISEEL